MAIMLVVNQPNKSLPALGTCRLTSTTILPIVAFIPLWTSILLITVTSIYLRYKIIKSNRFFHSIQRTAADREKSDKAGQLVELLLEQVKPTISVFIVGGFDGFFDLLFISFVLSRTFLPTSAHILLVHLVAIPMQMVRSMAHSLAYGFYNKKIKEKMFTCNKLWPKRSKVIVINRQWTLNRIIIQCRIVDVYMCVCCTIYLKNVWEGSKGKNIHYLP